MKTIDCTVIVDEEHRGVLELPADVAPGAHQVRLILADEGQKPDGDPLAGMPSISVGNWPADLSLRRKDMYGDDER